MFGLPVSMSAFDPKRTSSFFGISRTSIFAGQWRNESDKLGLHHKINRARGMSTMRPYGIATVADLGGHESSTTKRLQLWREWYKSPIWKSIKRHRLIQEPNCRICGQEGRPVSATHVAHVRPYEGHESLFTSYENTQSLCARHYKQQRRI
jgi:hypothetical protein